MLLLGSTLVKFEFLSILKMFTLLIIPTERVALESIISEK